MKKVTMISLILLALVRADEFIEEPIGQVSAVSKVMERFSKLSTIESTPIEEIAEESVTKTAVIEEQNIENLEVAQVVKTAKFESKEMPYPEDKKVVKERVEKAEKVQPKVQPMESKEKSLREIEANARKVIEEEMQKVEEAKASALKKINEAMEHVALAKQKEKEANF